MSEIAKLVSQTHSSYNYIQITHWVHIGITVGLFLRKQISVNTFCTRTPVITGKSA